MYDQEIDPFFLHVFSYFYPMPLQFLVAYGYRDYFSFFFPQTLSTLDDMAFVILSRLLSSFLELVVLLASLLEIRKEGGQEKNKGKTQRNSGYRTGEKNKETALGD